MKVKSFIALEMQTHAPFAALVCGKFFGGLWLLFSIEWKVLTLTWLLPFNCNKRNFMNKLAPLRYATIGNFLRKLKHIPQHNYMQAIKMLFRVKALPEPKVNQR